MTMALKSSATSLETSAGVSAPVSTSSLTAGAGMIDAGWAGGVVVGLVGAVVGLL